MFVRKDVSILLVDDEPKILNSYKRVLRGFSPRVFACESGQEALDFLKMNTVDIILSDIEMPDMTGIRFLRNVRAENLSSVFMFMTGKPDLTSAIEATDLGAMRYLLKPIAAEDLLQSMEDACALLQVERLKREALQMVHRGDSLPYDRASLEAMFERALASLYMVFQPIVSWSDRKVVAFEALVRSRERGMVNPENLISTARNLNRELELGRLIRSRVSDSIGKLPQNIFLFVNLEPEDLLDDQLYDPSHPFSENASRMVLEVTEKELLHRVRNATARVQELREMGFRIGIDDLGTGYSGLGSFAILRPDFVKIDHSLISGIDLDGLKQRLVHSFGTLCANLNISMICEGVEEKGECEQVHSLGGNLMQGFYFARPSETFRFPALLDDEIL